MAGESARDLRVSTIDELREREKEIRQELFNLRFHKATGEIGDHARIKLAKKDLARVLTVIREKLNVSGQS